MMRRTCWLTISVSLSLLACGKQEVPHPAVPPAPIFVSKSVDELAIYPERSAPASVVGKHEARLSAEVAAPILAIPVDVGQTVERGEVVVRLDARDAELALDRAAAAVAQAEARHAQAKAQFERARALREKNFISAEALTLRETELAAASADLRVAIVQHDTARRALEKHTLRAPFAAVVRSRSGQVGELATMGAALMTLVSREVELAAQLQPRDVESLRAAVLPAPIFETAQGRYELRLLRISPVLQRESRSIEARLAFVGEPPAPGTEGRLIWREGQAHLPADLLVLRDGRLGVFVVAEGKARFHALPDAQEGRPAMLDLPLGTRIVTQGRHALQDGQSLE
ncbi:MAG: efflux RND transporter periplasmic adaptor subunit [Rhodocyclaceae bacterium]